LDGTKHEDITDIEQNNYEPSLTRYFMGPDHT